MAPEWHTPATQMDAGTDAAGPITVMKLRHGNGQPYQIPVDSPILPANFPRHHAVGGFLPSDWKLKQTGPSTFEWIPLDASWD